MVWRQKTGVALVALGAAALGTGFLVGFATAPHGHARAPVAAAPTPSVTPPPTEAPSATPAPTEAATPPPAAAPPPPPTAAGVVDGSPDAAVAEFYRLVQQHQFDAAVRLWSPRMQAAYPPGENIYQRFADTTSLNLLRDQVSQRDAGTAVVAIDLVEVRSGQTYRWTGSWYLVRPASGWLLDQPALRPG